jgi:hypothetical protein
MGIAAAELKVSGNVALLDPKDVRAGRFKVNSELSFPGAKHHKREHLSINLVSSKERVDWDFKPVYCEPISGVQPFKAAK